MPTALWGVQTELMDWKSGLLLPCSPAKYSDSLSSVPAPRTDAYPTPRLSRTALAKGCGEVVLRKAAKTLQSECFPGLRGEDLRGIPIARVNDTNQKGLGQG